MTDGWERRKAIYDQDCQFYRYQDGKKWGRFKTVATSEGAVLFGVYQVTGIGLFEKRILLVLGSCLIGIVSALSLKDKSDADSFLDRMREFENIAPFHARMQFQAGRYLMLLTESLFSWPISFFGSYPLNDPTTALLMAASDSRRVI